MKRTIAVTVYVDVEVFRGDPRRAITIAKEAVLISEGSTAGKNEYFSWSEGSTKRIAVNVPTKKGTKNVNPE